LTPKAKDFFIEKGFDPVFGARPLKRAIQRFLEDPLAEDIIKGRFKKQAKQQQDSLAKVKAICKGNILKFE